MTWVDWTTLFFALWGAALSTYLGIKEINKEKRQVKIILEQEDWSYTVRLILVNIGHRPITITDASMSVFLVDKDDRKQGYWDTIPAGAQFTGEGDKPAPEFPITIKDGEQTVLHLNPMVANAIMESDWKVNLVVGDAEGHKFTKFEKQFYDVKWGRSGKVDDKFRRRFDLKLVWFDLRMWFKNRKLK